MEIKPIKTEADYDAALVEIARLMEASPDLGSPEADRLDVLGTLVEAYEAKHHPIDPPDPVEAIKFAMEQKNLKAKDLTAVFGTRARVSEILNRRRRLTMGMAWKLHQKLGIPAESLLRPYELAE